MKVSKRNICLIVLLAAMIIPSLFKVYVAGLYLTFYRLAVPIILLACSMKNIKFSIIESQCLITFIIWILYGFFFMILITGVSKGALKELTGLILGAVDIYCLIRIIGTSNRRLFLAINIIKVFVVLCILIGFMEIITGIHLDGSFYNNQDFISAQIARYGTINMNLATGFQYNVNDFSSFLTFMAPLFAIRTSQKGRFIDLMALVSIMIICVRNRSTLCILTLLICIFLFVLKQRKNLLKNYIFFCLVIILIGTIYIASIQMCNSSSENHFSLIADLHNHLKNYQTHQGSSFNRIMLYIDTWTAVIDTKFLGIGPNYFVKYFTIHPSVSGLVNPHNFWLEILSQYGIVVFILYIFLLVTLYTKMIKIFKYKGNMEAVVFSIMFVDYIIVSLESSSFINYTYQWILIALSIAFIHINQWENKVHGTKSGHFIYNLY